MDPPGQRTSKSHQQQDADLQDVIMMDSIEEHKELPQQQDMAQVSKYKIVWPSQQSWIKRRARVLKFHKRRQRKDLRRVKARTTRTTRGVYRMQRQLHNELKRLKTRNLQLEAGSDDALAAGYEISRLRDEAVENEAHKTYQAEQLYNVEGELSDMTRQNATLKSEASRQGKHFSDLFNSLGNAQQAIKGKNLEIEDLQAQLAGTRAQLAHARSVAPAARGARCANADKVSDTFLQQEWRKLDYNIRGVAYMLLKIEPAVLPNSAVGKQLAYFTRKCPKALDDADARLWMLQRVVWETVYRFSFASNHRSASAYQLSLLKELKLHMADFVEGAEPREAQKLGQWFVDGGSLISKIAPDQIASDAAKMMAAQFTNELADCFPVLRRDLRTQHSIETDLEGVFKAAGDLQQLLLTSRAFFQVGFEFRLDHNGKTTLDIDLVDVEEMDDPSNGGKRIDVAIAPWCIKRGTADGFDYNKQIVLAKGQILRLNPNPAEVSRDRHASKDKGSRGFEEAQDELA